MSGKEPGKTVDGKGVKSSEKKAPENTEKDKDKDKGPSKSSRTEKTPSSSSAGSSNPEVSWKVFIKKFKC